ncbi:MAG: Calx-beta domain-containing protein [Fuerstiella sp.]
MSLSAFPDDIAPQSKSHGIAPSSPATDPAFAGTRSDESPAVVDAPVSAGSADPRGLGGSTFSDGTNAPRSSPFALGGGWGQRTDVSVADVVMHEGEDGAVIVKASQPASRDLMVRYQISAGSADDSDLELARGHVVIPAGEDEAVISVSAFNDGVLEGTENFKVELLGGPRVRVVDGTGHGLILDGQRPGSSPSVAPPGAFDQPSQTTSAESGAHRDAESPAAVTDSSHGGFQAMNSGVSLSVEQVDDTVYEGGTSISALVKLGEGEVLTELTTVYIESHYDGIALAHADGSDFTFIYAVDLGPEISEASFSIWAIDDAEVEPPEHFGLRINSAWQNSQPIPFNDTSSFNQYTIIDNDDGSGGGGGSLSFTVHPADFPEDGQLHYVEVERHTADLGPWSGSVEATNGTATLADYELTQSTISFPSGVKKVQVPVRIKGDSLPEDREEFTLEVQGYPASAGTIGIIDTDLTLSLSSYTFIETNVNQTIGLTVSRTGGDKSESLTVELDAQGVSGNPASGVTDYSLLNTSVVIPANAGSASFNVRIFGDTVVEHDENFQITASATQFSGQSYEATANTSKIYKIVDDDVDNTPPSVTGNGNVTATCNTSSSTSFPLQVADPGGNPNTVVVTADGASADISYVVSGDDIWIDNADIAALDSGSYSIYLIATDEDGNSATGTFTLTVTNNLSVPGPPTITGPGQYINYLDDNSDPDGDGDTNLTVTWDGSGSPESDGYSWTLYSLNSGLGGALDSGDWGITTSGGGLATSYSQDFGPGIYAFEVVEENCKGESPPAIQYFAVVDITFETLTGNQESQCGSCTCTCGMFPGLSGLSVPGFNGDLEYDLGKVMIDGVSPELEPFKAISVGGDTAARPVTFARWELPAAAQLDLQVGDNSLGAMTSIDNHHRSTDERFVFQVPVQVQVLEDPVGRATATVNTTATIWVPSVPTDGNGGNVTISNPVDTNNNNVPIPWLIDVAVPTQNRTNSPFGRGSDIEGLDHLIFTAGQNSGPDEAVLYRGNNTHVTYRDHGAGWETPLGSYTEVDFDTVTSRYMVTNATGRIQYFDASGRVNEVVHPDGTSVDIVYASSDLNGDGAINEVTSVTNSDTGEALFYEYDSNGNLEKLTHSLTAGTTDDRDWTFSYDSVNNLLESVTGPADPLNPTGPRPLIDLVYSPSGSRELEEIVTTETGAAPTVHQKATIVFDTWGNVSSITAEGDSETGSHQWEVDSAESALLNGEYLWEGSIDAETITHGPVDVITLSDGTIVSRMVDRFGNVLRESQDFENAGPIETQVTEYERNSMGQVTLMKGPYLDGDANPPQYDYAYDTNQRLTDITYPDQTTESWTYFGLLNGKERGPHQPDTYTNRMGARTVYGYDAFGSVDEEITYKPGSTTITTDHRSWEYTDGSSGARQVKIERSHFGYSGETTGDSRPSVHYYYDGMGQLIHLRHTTFAANYTNTAPTATTDVWESFGYDAYGNLEWTSPLYTASSFDGSGLPVPPDATLRTEYANDVYGNVLTMTLPDPDGTGPLERPVYGYTYDSAQRLTTSSTPPNAVQSAADVTTTYVYNALGQLRDVIMPDPDGSGSLKATTVRTEYDPLGNPKLVQTLDTSVSPVDVLTSQRMEYNSLGQLVWESQIYLGDAPTAVPSQERDWYRYDGGGRLAAYWEAGGYAYRDYAFYYDLTLNRVTTTDPQGKLWFTTYNADGQVASETTPDPDYKPEANPPANGPLEAITTSYSYASGNTDYTRADGSPIHGTLITRTVSSGGESLASSSALIGTFGQQLVSDQADPDGSGPMENFYTVNEYDQQGNLTFATEMMGASIAAAWSHPKARTTEMKYNTAGQMTELITPDPDGAGGSLPQLFAEYQYDNLGRLTSQFAPRPVGSSGSVYPETTFEYYANSQLLKVTYYDRDAFTSNDWYAEYEYDNLDRQTKITTPNADNSGTAVTDYEYDQLGHLWKEILPEPSPNKGRPVTEYVYDSLVPGQAFSPGVFLTEVKAPTGQGTGTTKYEYDSAGRVIAEYRPNPSTGAASSGAYQKWSYDDAGRVESREILRSIASGYYYDTVDYQYDALGRVTSQGTAANRDEYEYDALGNLSLMTDPLDRQTQYEYDDWGRVAASHRLVSGSIHDTTETAYDSLGRVESSTQTDGTTSLTTFFEYDALDRQTKIIGPSGAYQDFRYRSWGPLERYRNEYLQPTYYTHDSAGRVIAVDETGDRNKVEYTHNAFGSVATETRHLNGTNTAVYSYEYDDLGRLTTETLPAIGGSSSTTVYDHDLAGNLVSLVDPAGNTTTWDYDHRNRKTLEEITVGTSTFSRTWSYFENDTVNWYKDRNNEWIGYEHQYVYGAGHRVYQEKWWDTTYAGGVTYSFDTTGLLTEEVKTHAPGSGTYIGAVETNLQYFYDDLGRVTTTRDYLTGSSDDVTWRAMDVISAYDAFDRRTSSSLRFKEVQTSGGPEKHRWDSSIYTTWNADSEVTSVTQYTPLSGTETTSGTNDTNSRRRADLTYFANGDLKTITRTEGYGATLSDSLVSTYALANGGWHPGRIGSIVHSGMTGSTTSQSYSWTYEDGGRISTFTPPEGQRTYNYDDLGQLTQVTGSLPQSQSYDANGNRAESQFTVDDHNRLLDDGTYLYQYDAEGRRTRRTLQADNSFEVYEYSIRGLLTSVTRYAYGNSGTNYESKVEYEYDGQNRRIRRKVDSNGDQTFDVQQRFVYDTNVLDASFDEVVLILDETQSWDAGTDTFDPAVESRLMNGPLLDQVFAEEDGSGEIFWLLQDNQQTVRDVARFTQLDGDAPHEAELVNHLDYDAFGKIVSQTPGAKQPLQTYTGQILDDVTGLMYYDARWFDPATNQFISEDPLGFEAGDTNLRRYVGNGNPNATDPSGMSSVAGLTLVDQFEILDGDKYSSATIARARLMLRQYLGALHGLRAQLDGEGQALSRRSRVLRFRYRGCDKTEKLEGLRIDSATFRAASKALNNAVENARIIEYQLYSEEIQARWREYGGRGSHPRLEARHVPSHVSRAESPIIDLEIRERLAEIVLEMASAGIIGSVLVVRRGGQVVSRSVSRSAVTSSARTAPACAPNNSGGWIRRPEGTRLKQVGNYWIKEVDPDASAIQRWWGRGSLNAQARALENLGDMAPSHLFKNGRLVMRDAGTFSGTTGDFWRIWAKGSYRMGTPFNDIRPRNIGSAGQIFDPALHPIQEGVYWTGAGVVVVGGGTWVYYEIQSNE